MSSQVDRQRARRDRGQRPSARSRDLLEQVRQSEILLAQVLNLLAQRDATVFELEQRAGRLLIELEALRWRGSQNIAAAHGVSAYEARRLRRCAQADVEPVQSTSVVPSLVDSPMATGAQRDDGRDKSDEE